VFSGCKNVNDVGEGTCQNGEPGEIATTLLRGRLGFIRREPAEVGVGLEPTFGETVAEFICRGTVTSLPYTVTGSVIVAIVPINGRTSKFTERFRTQSKKEMHGSQIPESSEGGPRDVLFTHHEPERGEMRVFQTGLSITETIANEERLEVRTAG